MNASLSHGPTGLGDLAGPPPILIAASSDQARARAASTAESSGYRTAAVAIEEAVDRLDIQAAASAIWIELDRDAGAPLDRLLDRVDAQSGCGSFPAIVCAPSAMIDPIASRIHNSDVHLLFDPTAADRVTTLAVATAWTRATGESRNFDIAREPNSARLRQLSDEVSRIAATLARHSVGPGAPAVERLEPAGGEVPPVSLEHVRQIIRARRLRAKYFDEGLFADPAWDMLLDLLQAEIAQHRVPVSSLCIAAALPATTALRWIKAMTESDLLRRRADPHDGRRIFVEMSPQASDAMHRFFAQLGGAIVI